MILVYAVFVPDTASNNLTQRRFEHRVLLTVNGIVIAGRESSAYTLSVKSATRKRIKDFFIVIIILFAVIMVDCH